MAEKERRIQRLTKSTKENIIMANLNEIFDATKVTPQTSFDPLPSGEYAVMIIDSQMVTTKSGTGQYLELTLQVIEGQHTNRLLWDRLTLIHPKHETVQISQRQLSAICHATGVLQIQDSAQLHNIPMRAQAKYVEGEGQWGPKNKITSYKKASGQTQPSQQAQATATAAPAPWENGEQQQSQPAKPAQAPARPPWETAD